jgi:cation:H+ antiporter
MEWFFLILSLFIILIAAELFTNSVEWLGVKLGLCAGAVGSILAAVGTALPETIVPIVAIFLHGKEGVGTQTGGGEHVGIGAILGAPFMLSTLAMFVIGVSVLIYHKTRGRPFELRHDWKVFRRDLEYFLICYILAFGAAFIPGDPGPYKLILGILLVVAYFVYVNKTIHGGGEELAVPDHLHSCIYIVEPLCGPMPFLKPLAGLEIDENVKTCTRVRSPHMALIIIQIAVSLALIILGANFFVSNVMVIAGKLGVSALVLSLVIAPVATELPEKFNSIIWLGRNKDTLALGNITGAMVFQASFPVTVGLWFTHWDLRADQHAIYSALIAIIAGIYLLILSYFRKHIEAWWVMVPVLLYLLFIATVIFLP